MPRRSLASIRPGCARGSGFALLNTTPSRGFAAVREAGLCPAVRPNTSDRAVARGFAAVREAGLCPAVRSHQSDRAAPAVRASPPEPKRFKTSRY
jgi:hypothetical protein